MPAPPVASIATLNLSLTIPQTLAGYPVEIDNVSIYTDAAATIPATGNFAAANTAFYIKDSAAATSWKCISGTRHTLVTERWSATPIPTGPVDVVGLLSQSGTFGVEVTPYAFVRFPSLPRSRWPAWACWACWWPVAVSGNRASKAIVSRGGQRTGRPCCFAGCEAFGFELAGRCRRMRGGVKTRTSNLAGRGLICLALGLITLAVFWPSLTHDFLGYDDQAYVTENPHVRAGLTWPGVVWAFRSFSVANWHPLTWLSHMLDCQALWA